MKRPADISSLYGPALETFQRYAEVNGRAWEKLSHIQMEAMEASIDCAARQWRCAAQARTPMDGFGEQWEIMTAYSGKVADMAGRTLETLTERQRDAFACLQGNGAFPFSLFGAAAEGGPSPQHKREAA